MQHLNSSYRDEDVENEAKTENLLLRYTEGIDVGSVAEREEISRGVTTGMMAAITWLLNKNNKVKIKSVRPSF